MKDVSVETKMKYLKKKYEQACKVQILWEYIEQQLKLDPKIKIEGLEYLCQLSASGLAYFYKGIEILGFPQPKHSPLSILPSEEQVTQLLPLSKEYNIRNVEVLVNAHTTLSKTSFSICLIGDANTRDNMAGAIAYLQKKSVTKVILSTMTDMADLLGSYEQVYSDSRDDEDEEVEEMSMAGIYKSIYKANLSAKIAVEQQSTATSFKYVESRIMKTLSKPHSHLLYVEVPNEALLERVEKGIKQIFAQKVQVLIGLDKLESANNTKLIALRLDLTEGTI